MKKKNIYALIAASLLLATLGGYASQDPDYEPVESIVSSMPAPETEKPVVSTQIIEDEEVPTSIPAIDESDDVDSMESTQPAASQTKDEKLIDKIIDVCSVQATCETDADACVIDVRNASIPYDVKWDYGSEYTDLAYVCEPGWDYVFDAEYYKETFPMLAMQYHYDDYFLKRHFTTVGIHEGRQGSKDFNVKAFMDACPQEIRDTFGDNYACYYLYYIHSDKVDRSMDLSGKGCPKQMTAVMTYVQKQEFELINEERERLEVEPLVFDSELAAIANYRAWINVAERYNGHDWARQNRNAQDTMLDALGGNRISENTTARFNATSYTDWFYGYKNSESHYNAMINTKYHGVGCSNVYAGDNTYTDRNSDTRWIHFDVFMDTVDTALNPKQ